jgi:hypothetical protein
VEIPNSGCASCNSVVTESSNKVLMYVVLVILIALWAMVLLPPYLKDRRASGRTFGSMQSGGVGSAQRFLPLQQASTRYSTSAVSSPTGMRTSGVNPLGAHASATARPALSGVQNLGHATGNVVQLRPLDVEAPSEPAQASLATSASADLEEAPLHDESLLHPAWAGPDDAGIGMPTSTAAARERRRQVLLGLTGVALLTLLLALFVGGRWVAAHVLVDVVMLGYVILLVRHRQLAADQRTKVEPIRPPVTEQTSSSVQLAPSYLLRENTGS